MLKQILCGCVALSVTLFMNSCGREKKATEKLQEALLNATLPGDVKADIDGNNMSITDNKGNRTEIGSGTWPKGELGDTIPKFTGGTLSSSVVTTEACLLTFNDVDKKEADDYLTSVRTHGFDQDIAEFTVNTNHGYQATHASGLSVMVNYDSASKNLIIALNRKSTDP